MWSPTFLKFESGIVFFSTYSFFKIWKHVTSLAGSCGYSRLSFPSLQYTLFAIIRESLADCLEIHSSPVSLTALWALQRDTVSSAWHECLYLEQCLPQSDWVNKREVMQWYHANLHVMFDELLTTSFWKSV